MAARPPTPSNVALHLRKESGFGCCRCGFPVVQYHHIIEYADEPHFRPEDMMTLCARCHEEATKGAMTVTQQRRYKAHPYNIGRGWAAGPLTINHDECVVEFAAGQFVTDGDLLRVDGEPLLRLSRNIIGALDLTLALYDRDDNLLVRIVDNEWISVMGAAPWDLDADYQFLRIRQRKGDIRLEVDTETQPIKVRATLWRKGKRIEISPRGLVLGEKAASVAFKDFVFRNIRFELDTVAGTINIVPTGSAQPL